MDCLWWSWGGVWERWASLEGTHHSWKILKIRIHQARISWSPGHLLIPRSWAFQYLWEKNTLTSHRPLVKCLITFCGHLKPQVRSIKEATRFWLHLHMGCQTSGYCIWKHADRELSMEENNASLFLCSLALRNPLSTMIWVCEFRWIQVLVIWEWLLLGTVTVWRFLKKLKMELPYDPTIALLGIYLKKTKTLIWTCISVVIAALFTTAKVWKQPKCPSTGEWMKKMWCIFCCCVGPKLCLTFLWPHGL